MQNDKRALRRIDNKFGTELYAIVEFGSEELKAIVVNYNSLSALIEFEASDFERVTNHKVNSLQLFYGSLKTGSILNPKIIRILPELHQIIFNLATESVHQVPRENRVDLTFDMQGIVTGTDPFTIDQALTFRLYNISKNGFALLSSKSNRHLTAGLRLENFKILLPNIKPTEVTFLITNIIDAGPNLKIGCRFEKVSPAFLTELNKLIFTSSKILFPEDSIDDSLKQQIKSIKNFSTKIRVRRVTSEEEYEEVLKLRYKSYREAKKIKMHETWKDMQDEYDKHSVIYVAYIGRIIAGTIRLVVRTPDAKLPFENQINLSEVKRFNQNSAAEVTRFAIDPHFQGTDLFYAMFRKIIFEIAAKGIESPVCLATKKLSKYYKGVGAIEISKPIPHPTLPDETLTLYLFNPDDIYDGNMSALGWFYIAKPAVKLLRKFHLIRKPSTNISKYFKVIFEVLGLALHRTFKLNPKATESKQNADSSQGKSA